MKGTFNINPLDLEKFNREEGFTEYFDPLTRILNALPLEYALSRDLSPTDSIDFKVTPEDSNLVNGVELPVYEVHPSEEVEIYDNLGGLGVILVDAAQSYVTVLFSGKLFTLNYKP